MNPAAQLASKGRYGDNNLMHVSDVEIQGLDNLAKHLTGKPLSVNPETGLKEAFAFLPFIAPLAGGALGMGTMGTAALGAGLGAYQAYQDGGDPLMAGLMGGLSGGAAGSLMGNLRAAGTAATAAPGVTGTGASAYGAAVPGVASGGQQASMLASQTAGFGPEGLAMTAGSGAAAPGVVPGVPISPTPPVPPPRFGMESLRATGEGARGVMTGAEGFPSVGEFASDNLMQLGGIGAGAISAADAQTRARLRRDQEAREAEREAERQRVTGTIRDAYSRAGRDAPWLRGYAEGGQVPYPMQSGGFVMTADAVGGAGGQGAMQQALGARPITGPGTGTSDSIPATIDGVTPARVSNGEAYVPPQNVQRAGGPKTLENLMKRLENRRKGK